MHLIPGVKPGATKRIAYNWQRLAIAPAFKLGKDNIDKGLALAERFDKTVFAKIDDSSLNQYVITMRMRHSENYGLASS